MAKFSPGRPKVSQMMDSYGNVIKYGNAGDHWHPTFPIGEDSDYRTHVRRIRDMEIRPDDVLICSYPKTGFHWTNEIVKRLMKKTSDTIPVGELTSVFLDKQPSCDFDKHPSPRVLSTHVPFRYIPRQALKKKIKIIFLERNPKDVLVSWYCHITSVQTETSYQGTFDQFFRVYFDNNFVYGHLFDYLLEWQEGMENFPSVETFTSVFEDMKQNSVQGVIDLNTYLGTGCSLELCEEIAKACTFEALKPKMKDDGRFFYRKGQVGDWKNWFTVAMNEEFDKEYEKRMSGYKLKYKCTL